MGAADHVALGAGFLIIRPLAAEEAPLLASHVAALSPASRHSRFLGGVNLISEAEALRLVAGRDVFALAAIAGGPGEGVMVGEAICAFGSDGRAEFALSVADAWQGRGIGRALVASLARRAAPRAALIHGEVLAGNRRMLALAARAGFAAGVSRSDPRLVAISRPLRPVPAACRPLHRAA
ncbi:GNAT family N-acetyltransferase [Phreatobacter cathodiphilus]|uniref:GNAT family N-acetyltransferase n=1 Tax=Phreatobacter cathodiphilus TaxID=1868589 RepID=A0A2S0NB47_9HYPH|nr:GNAT family N-acetyltransferase [Phreatobacter cathodiphilus]AVO45316.1 GNAT family N-acetyltransferase [Phreatobacter cathodiphilus]